jgi:hypothetical protein
MEFLLAIQRWTNTAISADLSAFAATRDWGALLAVLPLGIVFGAAHALTPGHDKTVIPSLCCRNSVKLQPVPDQPKTQPLGNLLLEPLDLSAPELNHSPGGHVDQVVVVRLRCLLIMSTTVTELVPFNDADLLETLHRSVNCREGHTPVPFGYTAIQLRDIGMISGLREHLSDQATLTRQAQTLCSTLQFDLAHGPAQLTLLLLSCCL